GDHHDVPALLRGPALHRIGEGPRGVAVLVPIGRRRPARADSSGRPLHGGRAHRRSAAPEREYEHRPDEESSESSPQTHIGPLVMWAGSRVLDSDGPSRGPRDERLRRYAARTEIHRMACRYNPRLWIWKRGYEASGPSPGADPSRRQRRSSASASRRCPSILLTSSASPV